MADSLSPRLRAVVDALPLRAGMRVLEIGCGPGAAAREIAFRVGADGFVLGLDRSAAAITAAERAGGPDQLAYRRGAIEEFVWDGEPFDLAFAVRVGALDGRHPSRERPAFARIAAAVRSGGSFHLDTGNPMTAVDLTPYRE
ncbi:methyltransferase domain-containing protein [Rhodococcus rhodnii]|uniref:Methyltransferase domain-containing protein n=2 Tax=Rhodococcus rhodnii TaxID=38312 RepID=R7WIT5_9NOCA|nr:methyltransferase domain-containing protein [Rhodococcus rhodnii]EOM75140.1 hypothetical protein Rrhod_3550 [Rhodococcus rhodnii LMG 5362]TXG89381.1 methyltransferase domain-containing protein [Rhodococcus rhodnii]